MKVTIVEIFINIMVYNLIKILQCLTNLNLLYNMLNFGLNIYLSM
jgi:hypothetical protein